MTPELLKQIIADQREEEFPAHYVKRQAESKLSSLSENKEIIVIKGVRRCGKSVLLQKLRQQAIESDYYFNFEDERLVTFNVKNFQMLYEVLIELFGPQKTFYFDEIQNIPGWELFVRRLYNQGCKIYITGSNANLFSEELGTRLTGRYIAISVYPYSFRELVQSKAQDIINKELLSTVQTAFIKKLFSEYCQEGGIPAFIEHHKTDYLHSLYESIVYRDIIARYKLSSDTAIKTLIFYLASNCSKEITYNSLRKLLGLGSATTVSAYCEYLKNSYLCFFINCYSESVKSQLQSPKKVYFIDHMFAKTIGFRFSDDRGRMLENIVFLELKRQGYDIYYHKDKRECDFVVKKDQYIHAAIQVCQTLHDPKTKQREIDGLTEAMIRYSLKEGTILTENEDETLMIQIDKTKYKIIIQPIWKWLLK